MIYLEVEMSEEQAGGREQLVIPGLETVLGLQLPPGLKFEVIGETHTLTITNAQPVRDRDFKTNDLLSWPSGDPKMVLVLIGDAEDGVPASFWVRGRYATEARKKAYVAAGVRGVARGDVLTITRIQDIEIPGERKGQESVFANGWEMSVVPAATGAGA